MNGSNIRVLIVEDHPLYRVGLRMALSFSSINNIIKAETENVAQTIDYLRRYSYEIDLILLDYYLPDGTGMDILSFTKKLYPNIKVLLISGEENNSELNAMIAAGLNGFISKDVTPQGLATVISSIFQGKDFFSASPESINSNDEFDAKSKTLTKRELDIIRLCALGKSSKEIANDLCISARTVESHKDNIFNKLDCNSTTEMVNYAFVNGLV